MTLNPKKIFKEIGSHSLIFGIGNILVTSSSIILIPLYVNYLTLEDYGILSIFFITISLLSTFLSMSLQSALFRFYFAYDSVEEKKTVVSTTFIILLINLLLASLTVFMLSPQLSQLFFNNDSYSIHISLITYIAGFKILNIIPFTIFRANKLSQKYVVYNFFILIIKLSTIIYLVVSLNYGLLGVLYGTLAVNIFSAIILYYSIRSDFSFTFSFNISKKLVSFGFPLIFSNLGGFIIEWSDRFILGYYYDLETVGLYSLGCQICMILLLFLNKPLKLIWRPVVYSIMKDLDKNIVYSKMLTYYLILSTFSSFILIMLSDLLISIIAPEEYALASNIVFFILFSYILLGSTMVTSIGVGIKKKTSYSALITIICAILNILLNIIFIPKYSFYGAALSTLVTYFLMFFLSFQINQALLRINYEYRKLGIILLLFLSFSTFYYFFVWGNYGLIYYFLPLFLIYVSLLLIFKCISLNEIRAGLSILNFRGASQND